MGLADAGRWYVWRDGFGAGFCVGLKLGLGVDLGTGFGTGLVVLPSLRPSITNLPSLT